MLAAFEFKCRRTYGDQMKKKELSDVAQQECAALKAIFMAKRKDLGLTQEKAAAALGMNQGSFSHYLNGRNALNIEFAAKVAKLLGAPVSEFSPRLARAIDDMTISSQEIRDVTEKIRRIYSPGTDEPSNVLSTQQPWKPARSYPLISWIAAGDRAESPDNYRAGHADEHLDSTENAGDSGYWLDVRGPSMTSQTNPSFPEGTKILVKPEGFDLISGKFYIARHRDGEKTFKQYLYDAGTEYLIPLNPAYKPVEIDSDWEIIGRVVDAKIPGL